MNASGPPATANGTSLYQAAHFNVLEECILWDDTCQGDKLKAASIFFNQTLEALLGDECFTVVHSDCMAVVYLDISPVEEFSKGTVGEGHADERPVECDPAQCPGGIADIPRATLSLWSTLKSWMREPACASSSLEYSSKVRDPSAQEVIDGCCGPCAIDGPNVDVYYWPLPEANTSCLSIIGTSVNPPTQDATTADLLTYWGYNTTDDNRINRIVTTMIYTEINKVWFKMPVINPWEAKPGASVSTDPVSSNLPKLKWREESLEPTIRARANPIAIPNLRRAPLNESNGDTVGNVSSPGSTVIHGSHTFTSPSIYVNFYSLSATDQCGYRGPTIDSTLLAFAPGELSTIATAMFAAQQNHITTGSVYNFNDLPCPPMSVMSSQWYKPEPGEPFRPMIVFPSKLLDIHPLWKICTPGCFTGYDPPRALDLETALVPKVTPSSTLKPNLGVPKPAATHESLPRRTSISTDPTETLSYPSLAKSHIRSGVQDDISQKIGPPKSTKIVLVDHSTKNEGSSDSQKQSLQANPESSDPKDGLVEHAPLNTAASSDPNQQSNEVHANKEASNGDGDTSHEPQMLASSSTSRMTAILGSHDGLAGVQDTPINSIDFKAGASASAASGQKIAIFEDEKVHVNPAVSPFITSIANHILTSLLQGVVIQGTTLKNQAPAAIIASTTFSLDASNNRFVNGHSYLNPKPTPQPTTINNEAIRFLPTSILRHSTNLIPGAPALIISGKSNSPDPSKKLSLNEHSSRIPKATLLPTTINNEAVLPMPTGLSIHSTTLMPGTPALIIEGTTYSLDPSSNLHYQYKIEATTSPVVTGTGTTAPTDPLISSSSGVAPFETPVQTSAPILSGSASQGPGNSTWGGRSENNSSALTFTGGAQGGRSCFSRMLLLSLLIGAWSVVTVRFKEKL